MEHLLGIELTSPLNELSVPSDLSLDRGLRTYHLTLPVERQALNLVVVGSSPTVGVLLLTLAVK